MRALVVDDEAFALEQDMRPPVTESTTFPSQFHKASLRVVALALQGLVQHAARKQPAITRPIVLTI